MRVGLQTWGTEGDVRPFIALAAGLVGRGHRAALSVTEIRNGDYSRYGHELGFSVMHPGRIDRSDEKFNSLGQRFVAARNPALVSRLLVENFLDLCLDEMFEAAMELCSGSDLVIGHLFSYSIRAAAMKTGVPWVALYTTPVIPSRTLPPPGWPGFIPMAGWKAFGTALNRLWRPGIARFHRKWGVPEPRSVMEEVFFSREMNLVAVSPALYPGGGAEGYRFCGAMTIPGEAAGKVSPELQAFLKGGEPPVYITFGSMFAGENDPDGFLKTLLQAVGKTGCRTVIQCGRKENMGRVLLVDREPHSLVFPRCAAVVHHGGSGTSHAVCAAGVPSVVVPYVADQPIWAGLLKMSGLAPGPVHRRSLTSRKLARRIKAVLHDTSYSARAREVSDDMRADNGVESACELLERKYGG